MTETILVVGATGMLGEPVARRLAADGHHVRAMSREISKAQALFRYEQNITAVAATVNDLQSLQTAMQNCTGVHINLSGGSLEAFGTEQVVKVAHALLKSSKNNKKKNIMKRITLISGVTTCKQNCWYEGTRAKLQAETYLKDSGFDYTIFRCTMFQETLPKWKCLVGDQPTKWHWLAAEDYARMVSKSFTSVQARNKTLFLYGPGPPATIKEAVDDYFIPLCEPDRPPIPSYSLEDTLNPEYENNLSEPAIAKFEWLAKINELGDPKDANTILGAPTINLNQWCQEYSSKKKKTIS